MTPRLILFDCDGTLVDSQHMIVASMTAAFVAVGLPPPDRASVLATVGLSIPETMPQLFPGGTADVHAALAHAYRSAFSELRSKTAEPMFPEARDTLLGLAAQDDVLLGIATGKSRRGVTALLAREHLTAIFATVQTADDAPSKPHPGMILSALTETGVPPERTVIVGDSTYDMMMARSAGIGAIGVGWGYHSRENLLAAGAQMIVEDFAALRAVLDRGDRRGVQMSQAGDGKPGLPPQAFAGYDRKRLRRFYTTAGVTAVGGRWQVVLDSKPILTPGRVPLLLPTHDLAEAIAAEWREQGDEVLPQTMLMTRLANSTIDGVAGREIEVVDDILRYVASDLVSYRAESPERLSDVQAEVWDPVVEWAQHDLNAPITVTSGIMPVTQPPAVIEALRPVVSRYPAFPLAALHSITTLTGSALLALAYALGRLQAADVWKAAHVDEDWQIDTWGEDLDATRRRAARWLEMQAASRFFQLSACGI